MGLMAQIPDWTILLRVLTRLPLHRVSLTIHYILHWYKEVHMPISALQIPNGPLHHPNVKYAGFYFEFADLSKEAGRRDFDMLLSHTNEIYWQFSRDSPGEQTSS
jgi:hypothetical protein